MPTNTGTRAGDHFHRLLNHFTAQPMRQIRPFAGRAEHEHAGHGSRQHASQQPFEAGDIEGIRPGEGRDERRDNAAKAGQIVGHERMIVGDGCLVGWAGGFADAHQIIKNAWIDQILYSFVIPDLSGTFLNEDNHWRTIDVD